MVLACRVGVGGGGVGLYIYFFNSSEMERQSLLGTVVNRIDHTRTRL